MTETAAVAEASAAEDRAEFERRLAGVRELMAAEGFGAIVAADGDQWVLPGGHVRYLSNFSAGRGGGGSVVSAVVVPLREEPALVVAPGPLGCIAAWARESSWITRIQSTKTDRWPPEHDLLEDLVVALEESGASKGRVGVCGRFPGYDRLAERLSSAEIEPAVVVDGRGTERDLVERVREVKSDREIAKLKEAQRYAEASMTAFMAAVKPGRKLARAIAEGEWAAKSLGAEDCLIPMNAGNDPWRWWTYQGARRFQEGQLVSLETNARVDGYIAQLARGGVIGEPSDVQQRLMETAKASLAAMVEMIRPGVSGGDLWTAAMEPIDEAGLAPWGRFGHGMGMSMAEGLDVLPGDDRIVKEGHCIHLHAGVMSRETMWSTLVGDQFVVQGGEAVPLSDAVLPHDLAPSADVPAS